MAKKKDKPVGFKLDGHQRDHLRAMAHRGDDKALCDYVEALVSEVAPVKAEKEDNG